MGRPSARRDRFAVLLALLTVIGLGATLLLSEGTAFLMPGPLTSAHGSIENCAACHTSSGSGKLSWLHGLVAGDPAADSKACLTCHKVPDTAFNAHSAPAHVLKESTERLTKLATGSSAPHSARAQSFAFPTDEVVARGLTCATCHQEHQGTNFKLSKISNEQCRSCHVVQFDSFDGRHPKFSGYPFKKRTAIVYDHAGHFDKHYPELAKKDPTKSIPATCSTCHDSRGDKRVMAVALFEQTCTACHLDQIVGKERASGPKGIAFLSLPGLDLPTLKKKNAAIGEWPDASGAALTPFMKVMISRDERGRDLIKTVEILKLQDLADASDDQIRAVTSLAWEIKGLLYALGKGKASDVLGDLNIGGGAKLSPTIVADLTASIPHDVIINAQRQWLPNLATEMAGRPNSSDKKPGGWSTAIFGSGSTESTAPEQPSRSEATDASAAPSAKPETAESATAEPDVDANSSSEKPDTADSTEAEGAERNAKLDPPACVLRILGECLVFSGQNDKTEKGQQTRPADVLPGRMNAGVKDGTQAADPSAGEQPTGQATGLSDDLLFPTDQELREIKAHNAAAGNAGPNGAASADAEPSQETAAPADLPSGSPANSQTSAAPVIESDVDAESWAEYGGWYRQDYEIIYRPTGHKDKFITSWLVLTGPHAPKGDTSPAAAVFDSLTNKDAQGSCTKCHSVDDVAGNGRVVNFRPAAAESKQGRFTHFIHEPHFGIMENGGCLTCHSLEKGRSYLKSYERGHPQTFVSNFGEVKKDLCQTCHNRSMARQDCLTCHKYHVNGPVTPIMTTRNPTTLPP